MPHGQFNHASHTQVSCTTCHAAAKSRLTSDIIMPTQQSCVECHGPKGGVNFSCTECHKYHNTPPPTWRNSLPQ
jgi:predicted CXXCH cytochrome family protein